MKLFIILTFLITTNSFAKDKKEQGVIYEYKKYESFDLGNLEIKGKIIAPGDITINDKDRKVFKRNLYNRYNFSHKIKMDNFNIR